MNDANTANAFSQDNEFFSPKKISQPININFEKSINSLERALQEGVNSGIYPNFDPQLHLHQLKNRYSKIH